MRIAKRIETLPPYLFAELDKKLSAKRAQGVDVISLGVGDPDRPTPPHIVETMQREVAEAANHGYPSYYGSLAFREAVAGWYDRRYGVTLDPETEVMALIGSKEGIGHIAFAFLDPGDEALIPDPGYPVYGVSTRLAGATPVSLPMPAEKDFRPDMSQAVVSERTRALWLNFPSNPTAAVAEPATFTEAVAFTREHDLVLLHDAAYEEITYDGYVAPSVLQAPGAKDVALEFGSASKSFNMTGWRIGWAAGSAEAIRALGIVKTNLDSGQFTAVQNAAIAALSSPTEVLDEIRATYQRRRDVVVGTLNGLGWSLKPPLGSCYVWVPVPDGETSTAFADRLLDLAGVFVAPGSGYGERGEGYVRFSLTVADDRLDEAMDRIGKALAA